MPVIVAIIGQRSVDDVHSSDQKDGSGDPRTIFVLRARATAQRDVAPLKIA